MRQQSLSRKMIVAYSLLMTLAAGLLTSTLYWQFRTVQRQEMRERLLELLRLSMPQIDSDYLALTITADSMRTPFYKINQERLKTIQAAVPSIAHIYTLRQQPNGQLVFVLDEASANRLSTSVGAPVQRLTPRLKADLRDLKQPIVEPDLLRNLEGVPVLYGYAPITNQFGRIIGVLVIELNATSVIHGELQAGAIAAGVFCGVLLLTLVVIGWLAQALVIHPILRLNQASQQIASGQWDQLLPSDRADELGDLAVSFNQMAKQLRESFVTLEERVRDRTYQLRLAFAAAKMGNWEWDIITDRQYWSAENYSLWGLCTDASGRLLDQAGVEISPFPTFELVLSWVHPDDRDRFLQTIRHTTAQQQLYEIEYRICWGDGSIHWRYSRGAYVFNEQGQPIKLIGISMDITDRKQAEFLIQRQAEADQLLAVIAQTLNQSLRFDGVLATCLEQIRQFLQCDRVLVAHFEANLRSATKLEAVSRPELSLQNQAFQNPGFSPAWFESLRRGEIIVCNNVQATALPLWHAEFLSQIQVRGYVLVPILQADQLWGLLLVHQCDQPRVWQPLEVNLLKQLGLQIGTASQKASLYSQLENQLAQKEVLLKEVHHRVKNNLQIISAVIWLQSEAANDPIVTAALADTRNRLQAMSLTHEIFYQYKDLRQIHFDDYIQRLANNLLAAYSAHPDQITLILQLQPTLLALETAIPCGLLLNELITNAIKHGFPNQRRGEIRITLAPMAQPDPEAIVPAPSPEAALPIHSPQTPARCVLTIQDNGIGLPETLTLKTLKSLGLKLVYDLALQLDGNLELERQNGTLFRLVFSNHRETAGTLNE